MAVQESAFRTTTTRWKKFLREVRAELKKVTWPTRRELMSYTGVVFVAVVIIAAIIWLFDAGFTYLLKIFVW